jgi:radical SAM protein with 4Fe4S-binding SPASM domain
MLKLFRRLGYVPRRCVWEITLACNLRCGHCGSRAGAARPDELTTGEAFRVIDELAALGCRHVTLSGGEPTLRPDWIALVRRLRSHDVLVSVLSNGQTWTRELASRAREAGISSVGFSLDGLERTHDCVRRVPRGYRKVLRAIDITVAAGLTAAAVTHVTARNLAELERLHDLLHRHGVALWQVQLGVPMGNMLEDREAILDPAGILDLVPRLAAINRSGRLPRVVAGDNVGYYGDEEAQLRRPGSRVSFWIGCRAGLDVVGIESHGDVKGCLSLPSELNGSTEFVEGNVRDRSLAEIWNDPDAFAYNRRFRPEQLGGDCAGCDYGEICRGGCTWTSFAHTGRAHDFPRCFHAHAGRARDPAAAAASPG